MIEAIKNKKATSISGIVQIQFGRPSDLAYFGKQRHQITKQATSIIAQYFVSRFKNKKIPLHFYTLSTFNEHPKISKFPAIIFIDNEKYFFLSLLASQQELSIQQRFSEGQVKTYQTCTEVVKHLIQMLAKINEKQSHQLKAIYLQLSEVELKKKILSDLELNFKNIVTNSVQNLLKDKNFKDFSIEVNKILSDLPDVPESLKEYKSQLEKAGDLEQFQIDINHPSQILSENICHKQKWREQFQISQKKKVDNWFQLEKMEQWRKWKNQSKIISLQKNEIWSLVPNKTKKLLLEGSYLQIVKDKLLIHDEVWNNWLKLLILELKLKNVSKDLDYFKNNSQILETSKSSPCGLQSSVEKKYPKQMKILSRILLILSDHKYGQTYRLNIQKVLQQLQLNYQKIRHYLKVKSNQKTTQDKIKQNNAEQFDIKCIEMTNQQQKTCDGYCENCVTDIIQQTIYEQSQFINVDLKKNVLEFSKTVLNQQKQQSQSKLSINSWSLNDINQWAKSIKGKLTNSYEDICRSIAIIDRLQQILSGKLLRSTQVVSILLFLTQKQKGHISQILTGEGKTTIISFLTAIKALQGHNVDIITSNLILAQTAVTQKRCFYYSLGLTVSHNNPDEYYIKGKKKCYDSNIVYGSMSSFQFDYLRHIFQKLQTLGNRKIEKNWVILDQVDSLIIDEGSNIAKLSGPFPGMESLRYVYLNIWVEMQVSEEEIISETIQKINQKAKEIKQKMKQNQSNEANEQLEKQFNDYSTTLQENTPDEIRKRIISKKKEIINRKLMLDHVHKYAERKFQNLLDFAFAAKYNFTQNQQYKIGIKDREPVILPVDNVNTGVSMKDTILSAGLHQFLQIKHNLCLTFQSLTSCYISNVSYIKKYGHRIIGLTGTLGSEAEKNMLHSIYGVSFSSVPPYRQKLFQQYDKIVVNSDNHLYEVSIAALGVVLVQQNDDFAKKPRAVLIINQSIKFCLELKQTLQDLLISSGFNTTQIRLYTDQAGSFVTEKPLDINTIIIATNIAGRGTDLKTTQQLQINGGLHVIVSFLPRNKRVEDQAFGRTSRQGKKGTAQLIISQEQLLKIGLQSQEKAEYIISKRNEIQSNKIKRMTFQKIKQMDFLDGLFNHFCQLYSNLKAKGEKDILWVYVQKDLKQKWAFWLDQKQYKFSLITLTSVEKEFSNFMQECSQIIAGRITFNPYNLICLAEQYIKDDRFKEAKQSLDQALSIDTNSKYICSFAYVKLFSIVIDSQHEILSRYYKAFKEIFYCNFNNQPIDTNLAHQYLQKSIQSMNIEAQYLQDLLSISDTNRNNESSQKWQIKKSKIKYIIIQGSQNQNILIKHLQARHTAISLFIQNCETLIKDIKQAYKNNNNYGLAFQTKIPLFLEHMSSFDPDQNAVKGTISKQQIYEMEFIGLSPYYILRKIYDIPATTISFVRYQFLGGLTALSFSALFPIASPVLIQIAGALIGQAISDLINALIDQGETAFDQNSFLQSKIISYTMTAISCGLSVIANSQKLLKWGIKACKNLAAKLQACKHLKKICNFLANQLLKLSDYLRFLLIQLRLSRGIDVGHKIVKLKQTGKYDYFVKLQKISMAESEKKLTFLGNLKKIAWDSVKDTVGSIVKDKIINLTVGQILETFKPLLNRQICKNLQKKLDNYKDIIQQNHQGIDQMIAQLFKRQQKSQNSIAQQIGIKIIKSAHSWKIKAINFLFQSFFQLKDIICYVSKQCQKFIKMLKDKNLQKIAQKQGKIFDHVIKVFGNHLTDILYNKVKSFIISAVKTVPNLVQLAYKQQRQKKEQKKKIQGVKERQEQLKEAQISAYSAKCAHDAIGEILNVDSQIIADAAGIAPSSEGASLQDIKALNQAIGINLHQIFIQQLNEDTTENIKKALQIMKGDRGILCIDNPNNEKGHVISTFADQNGDIRVGSRSGILLEQFLINNKINGSADFMVGQMINQENISNQKRKMYKKIIQNASNPIEGYTGLGNGRKYGMKFSYNYKYFFDIDEEGQQMRSGDAFISYKNQIVAKEQILMSKNIANYISDQFAKKLNKLQSLSYDKFSERVFGCAIVQQQQKIQPHNFAKKNMPELSVVNQYQNPYMFNQQYLVLCGISSGGFDNLQKIQNNKRGSKKKPSQTPFDINRALQQIENEIRDEVKQKFKINVKVCAKQSIECYKEYKDKNKKKEYINQKSQIISGQNFQRMKEQYQNYRSSQQKKKNINLENFYQYHNCEKIYLNNSLCDAKGKGYNALMLVENNGGVSGEYCALDNLRHIYSKVKDRITNVQNIYISETCRTVRMNQFIKQQKQYKQQKQKIKRQSQKDTQSPDVLENKTDNNIDMLKKRNAERNQFIAKKSKELDSNMKLENRIRYYSRSQQKKQQIGIIKQIKQEKQIKQLKQQFEQEEQEKKTQNNIIKGITKLNCAQSCNNCKVKQLSIKSLFKINSQNQTRQKQIKELQKKMKEIP